MLNVTIHDRCSSGHLLEGNREKLMFISHQIYNFGGGQVVSAHVYRSDDPSSNHAGYLIVLARKDENK